MLNQFVFVGEVKEIPKLQETPNKIKFCAPVLTIKRNFKNSIGEFEYDEIPLILWRGIAENFVDTTNPNCLVAVKGRVQGNLETEFEFIVEKISILQEN